MKAERCVVDTNVLISALLQPSGRTAEVLNTIRAVGGFRRAGVVERLERPPAKGRSLRVGPQAASGGVRSITSKASWRTWFRRISSRSISGVTVPCSTHSRNRPKNRFS